MGGFSSGEARFWLSLVSVFPGWYFDVIFFYVGVVDGRVFPWRGGSPAAAAVEAKHLLLKNVAIDLVGQRPTKL